MLWQHVAKSLASILDDLIEPELKAMKSGKSTNPLESSIQSEPVEALPAVMPVIEFPRSVLKVYAASLSNIT